MASIRRPPAEVSDLVDGSPSLGSSAEPVVSLKSCRVAATLRPMPAEWWGALSSRLVGEEEEEEVLLDELDLRCIGLAVFAWGLVRDWRVGGTPEGSVRALVAILLGRLREPRYELDRSVW